MYALAAQRGLSLAHASLGRVLFERASPGDRASACEHYTHAADGGDADSMWALALMLQDGVGCVQDRVAAARWVVAAASRGHPAALADERAQALIRSRLAADW